MNTHRILNAGCGRDLSIGTDFIDAAPIDNRVIKCDMDCEMFPYDKEIFDEIYAQSVFEHLMNHANFMQQCHRILKEGGKLTIITDNASCLSFAVLYEHGKIIENWREGDAHYGLYTLGHLENYAKRFNFKVESATYEKGAKPFTLPKQIAQAILWKISKRATAYSIKVVMVK